MLQAPPRKWDHNRLKFFNRAEHEIEIENLSIGLTIDECLLYYGITAEVLNDPDLAYDKWFFMTAYNRGRIKAKKRAVDGLFQAVDKSSVNASLSYLLRFADGWEEVKDGIGDNIRGFQVTLVKDGSE